MRLARILQQMYGELLIYKTSATIPVARVYYEGTILQEVNKTKIVLVHNSVLSSYD